MYHSRIMKDTAITCSPGCSHSGKYQHIPVKMGLFGEHILHRPKVKENSTVIARHSSYTVIKFSDCTIAMADKSDVVCGV